MENSITGRSLENIPREMCQSLPTYSEQDFGTHCSNRKGMCRNVQTIFDFCLLIGISEALCTLRKNTQKQGSHSMLFGWNNNITNQTKPQESLVRFSYTTGHASNMVFTCCESRQLSYVRFFFTSDYPRATLGSSATVQSHNGRHTRKLCCGESCTKPSHGGFGQRNASAMNKYLSTTLRNFASRHFVRTCIHRG